MLAILAPEDAARITQSAGQQIAPAPVAETPRKTPLSPPVLPPTTVPHTTEKVAIRQFLADPTIPGTTKLGLTPLDLDFGEVHVGEVRAMRITLENKTDKAITIKNLHGSCGCLSVLMAVPTVAPGKMEVISVKYTGLLGRKSDTVSVIFNTDEENAPSLRIPAHAKIKQDFTVELDVLQFNQIAKGESKTLETTVRSVDGQPFSLKEITSDNKMFSFSSSPLEGGNNSAYRISATCVGRTGGIVSDIAHVTTDRSATVVPPIYLHAVVACDAVCNPELLAASVREDGSIAPFETLVKRVTPGNLEIQSVAETRKLKMGYIVTPVDEHSAKLSIHLDEPISKLRPLGQFVIQTNAEECPIRVFYRIVFPAKNAAPK